MKQLIQTEIFILTTLILYSCGPSAQEQATRDKALIDSTVKATVKKMSENKPQKPTKETKRVEDLLNFNWIGKYSSSTDYVSYTLTVTGDAPLRWAEYGWDLEAVGIQIFYKIKGYALRDEKGGLDLHFMETADGVFYPEDKMDMNKTMFKLKKDGDVFKPVNGLWKVADFVTAFKK